jgi:hypothetical protein
MSSLMRRLSPAEAEVYLARFAGDFARRGKRLGMDADREVLTYGVGGKGAALFPAMRCDFAELADERGSVFVDGDLVVDAWVENVGGLVFVAGNLITHSLYNSGYLVVGGDLYATRLCGEGERYGTLVFGDAEVASAVFSGNHHFDVWGNCRIDEEAAAWGVAPEPRDGMRTWAADQGRLSDERAHPRREPKSPPVVEALSVEPTPPPPRSPVVLELERWIETCGLTQREQLASLRSVWLSRLGPAERTEARLLIKRAINSKKLSRERDELLAALSEQG